MPRQRLARTSVVRYSAPVMGGTAAAILSNSPSAGIGTGGLLRLADAGKGAQRGHVARPRFPPIGQRRRKGRPDLVGAQDQQSVPGAACKRLLQPQAVLGLQSRRFPLRLQRLHEHQ